jgi:hypothetical protein
VDALQDVQLILLEMLIHSCKDDMQPHKDRPEDDSDDEQEHDEDDGVGDDKQGS